MPKAKPCIGYPSQADAVEALMREGLDRHAIAARIGIDLARTDRLMWRVRKRGTIARPAPRFSTWSPEKLDKARRLFDLTMAEIARALEVSVEDLLRAVGPAQPEPGRADDEAELARLAAEAGVEDDDFPAVFVNGTWQAAVDSDNEEQEQIPGNGAGGAETGAPVASGAAVSAHPIPEAKANGGLSEGEPEHGSAIDAAGDGQTSVVDGDAGADGEAGRGIKGVAVHVGGGGPGAAPGVSEAAPSAVASTAAQGEAQTAPVAEIAEAPPQYRLKHDNGEYLDRSGVGFTRALRRAWQGSAMQIEQIYLRRPEYRNLEAERVYVQ